MIIKRIVIVLSVFLSTELFSDSYFNVIPNINIKNQDKFELGKKLFTDKNLSSNKKISCSSCHNLSFYGTDKRDFSFGVNENIEKINTPLIYNTKYNIAQDSVGQASTIKQRAKMSFLNASEMNGNIEDLLTYLNSDIVLSNEFISIYGYVSEKNIFDSISYFVENLLSPNSKFDKFLKGEKSILTPKELRGYELFKKYGCSSCHNGVNIGGSMYQKFGIFISEEIKYKYSRFDITNNINDKNVFKVPSLRNIEHTAPYLHDGSVNSLKKVISIMGKKQLGITIKSKEIEEIESFLLTLTGDKLYE